MSETISKNIEAPVPTEATVDEKPFEGYATSELADVYMDSQEDLRDGIISSSEAEDLQLAVSAEIADRAAGMSEEDGKKLMHNFQFALGFVDEPNASGEKILPESDKAPVSDNTTVKSNLYDSRANSIIQDTKLDSDELARLRELREESQSNKARKLANRGGGNSDGGDGGNNNKRTPGTAIELWQQPEDTGENDDDKNWDHNDPNAQQAAANMFDIMAGGKDKAPTTDVELWQPILLEEGFTEARDKFVKAATEVRLSHDAKKGGKLRKLVSKLPWVGKKFAAEEGDSKIKAMEDAKAEMNRLVNENGIAVCLNERARLIKEGKSDKEIEEYLTGLSALGVLQNQNQITDAMNEMAENERKTSGFLGRWFNDLDKDGNAMDSSKFVKFMKKAASVGVIAGGVGFVAGAAVALAPVSGLVAVGLNAAAGLGAAVAGSKVGKGVAKSGYMQQNRVTPEGDIFANNIGEDGMHDIGFGIEGKVTAEQDANADLVKRGKKIGRIAAGIGFGAGRMAGNLWESSHRLWKGEAKNPFAKWSPEQRDAFARMVSNTENFDRYNNMVKTMAADNLNRGMKYADALGSAQSKAAKNLASLTTNMMENGINVPNPRFEYPSLMRRLISSTFENNTYGKGASTAMDVVNTKAYQNSFAKDLAKGIKDLAKQRALAGAS